jgi:AcrR family transcriptional regulator
MRSLSDDRDLHADGRTERRGDPARRILAATREVVGRRGFERARISDIAGAAKVARGAIFYYFGTKEHLVSEVLRADGDARLESLRRHLGGATSVDELVRGMLQELTSFLDTEQASHVFAQQVDGAALSNEELRIARRALRVRWRDELTDILRAKAQAGVIALPADPAVVGTVLTCLGHGIANELISDPDWDPAPTILLGERIARTMLALEQPLAP